MSLVLDRAAHLRTQTDELRRLEASSEALLVVSWRSKSLIAPSDPPRPVLLPLASCLDLVAEAPERVFLGTLGGRGVFAIECSPDEGSPARPELAGRGEFADLRIAGNLLDKADTELLAYARGMLGWHKHHRFCASCGGQTHSGDGGHVRICHSCERRHFPRSDPAIMALIVHQGRCLLARGPRFPPGMYSVLAGFVEPGESLEDAVAREVREEVGLAIREIRYVRSQPWPFPSSLMLGFAMRAESDRFTLDDDELEEARWVTPRELSAPEGFFVPPGYSLARQLIDGFVRGEL